MEMNEFLTSLVKVSFLVLAFIGVLALILGVVLFIYPNVLFQLLRWGSVGALVVGGLILATSALYGYIMANKNASQKN